MSNYNQLSSFIWNVCDDVLRGLFKPHEYGDVILPFTVLRRLDCTLESHKDEVYEIYEKYKSQVDDPTPIILNKINTNFFNHSKYDLSRLKSDPQNINLNFQNYIGGYSDNVVEIIENFQFDKPVQNENILMTSIRLIYSANYGCVHTSHNRLGDRSTDLVMCSGFVESRDQKKQWTTTHRNALVSFRNPSHCGSHSYDLTTQYHLHA